MSSRAAQDPAGLDAGFQDAVRGLGAARTSAGPPSAFWSSFVKSMAALCGASHGLILLRGDDGPARWRRIALWPPETAPDADLKRFYGMVDGVAADALDAGSASATLEGQRVGRLRDHVVGVRLETGDDGTACVGVFLLDQLRASDAGESLRRLALAADTPAVYQSRRMLERAQQDVGHLSSVIDLVAEMNAQKRFLAVAMTFCNALAGRHRCERVSLGWKEKNEQVRLQAISHTERFDRKMEAVRSLQYAMEEALDQDDEVIVPPPEGATLVSRDHQAYAKEQGAGCLCSLPLRVDGEAAGVVACERNGEPFGDVETRLLRISCDLAARRLGDLKRQDRWFGARWAARARELLGRLVGVEHTWAKVLGVVIAVGLGILVFGRAAYRVQAPFTMHTERAAYVPAPFEGYISEVIAEVGDEVAAGQALLRLDTRDLLLEEAAAAADRTRYLREAEKARAAGELADMRIAEALADQASARLDLVRYRLEQAAIRAPFDGIVVEGDLRERVGSPVRQGDVLFRVARLEDLHVRLSVDEADIQDVAFDASGEIAFASRPRLKFPVRVARVDPIAQAKEGANVFTVRCEIDGRPEPWWRPGMTGVGKVNAGRRNLLWIFTHKTVDFLRMRLWW